MVSQKFWIKNFICCNEAAKKELVANPTPPPTSPEDINSKPRNDFSHSKIFDESSVNLPKSVRSTNLMHKNKRIFFFFNAAGTHKLTALDKWNLP